MAWDEAHRRVVAYAEGQTWEWNGAGWKHRTNGPHPTALFSTALAWDGVGCRVLLFGGALTDAPNAVALDETWAWNGEQWAQLHPTHAPSARRLHAMAWDPARQRIVLFGGADAGAVLGDTWEWTGADWQRAATEQVQVSAGHAMAFDAINQRVMAAPTNSAPAVWGSSNGSWEWTGSTWVRVSFSSGGPPACELSASMAADLIEHRLVWLCGSGNQTWVWDGIRWQRYPAFDRGFYVASLVWSPAGRVMALLQTPIHLSRRRASAQLVGRRGVAPALSR